MAKVAKENSKESLKEISKMLHNILAGIEKGTHREKYLDYEIYGCLEKTSDNYIKVRVSEKAYKEYKEEFDNLRNYFHTTDELKHIPGKLKNKLHAEHIYPRSLLRDDLYEQKPDYGEDKILKLLEEKAKGILITKEESDTLDNGKDNLKASMPDDWKKVEDRLDAKKIKIHQESGKDVYYTISDF
ncbi:MAG: hypothetical protein K5829_08985 [Treponema sp.]|nr:hypothetical protein [Treponema sp.]